MEVCHNKAGIELRSIEVQEQKGLSLFWVFSGAFLLKFCSSAIILICEIRPQRFYGNREDHECKISFAGSKRVKTPDPITEEDPHTPQK